MLYQQADNKVHLCSLAEASGGTPFLGPKIVVNGR